MSPTSHGQAPRSNRPSQGVGAPPVLSAKGDNASEISSSDQNSEASDNPSDSDVEDVRHHAQLEKDRVVLDALGPILSVAHVVRTANAGSRKKTQKILDMPVVNVMDYLVNSFPNMLYPNICCYTGGFVP
jgi:hypothetical protein